MELTFYKYSATPNRVDKTNYLTEIGTLSGVKLLAETALMTPTFVLKTSPTVYNANYVYCSFTGRYYYIDSINALSGGRVSVECKIDVLYTYRAEILGSSAWVEASAGVTDLGIEGYEMLHNDYPFRADFDTLGCNFTSSAPSPFDPSFGIGQNILMIIK